MRNSTAQQTFFLENTANLCLMSRVSPRVRRAEKMRKPLSDRVRPSAALGVLIVRRRTRFPASPTLIVRLTACHECVSSRHASAHAYHRPLPWGVPAAVTRKEWGVSFNHSSYPKCFPQTVSATDFLKVCHSYSWIYKSINDHFLSWVGQNRYCYYFLKGLVNSYSDIKWSTEAGAGVVGTDHLLFNNSFIEIQFHAIHSPYGVQLYTVSVLRVAQSSPL